MSTNNLFELFDDKPGWQQAEAEIKAACLRFQAEIRALQERHSAVGAADTASREAIGSFVGSLIGSCTDRCLDPEWHVIDRLSRYNLFSEPKTWGDLRKIAVEKGLLAA
jgi:hypothetical protein